MNNNQLIIYQTEEVKVKIETHFEKDFIKQIEDSTKRLKDVQTRRYI